MLYIFYFWYILSIVEKCRGQILVYQKMVSPRSYLQNIVGITLQESKNKNKIPNNNNAGPLDNCQEFFDSSYLNSKTIFNYLTHIGDSLLQNIPNKNHLNEFPSDSTISFLNDEVTPSLYQMFQLLLPVMNQIQSNKKNVINGNDANDILQYYNINLPENIKLGNINRSYSINVLNEYSKEVLMFLDDIKLRINSTKSDIQTIDSKIEKLQKLKQGLNHRISLLNQNKITLDDIVLAIKTRKDFVKEYNLFNKEENNCDEDLLNRYLSEAKSSIDLYGSNIYEKSDSLPSKSDIGSPLLSQNFIPDTSSDVMSNNGSLSQFYDGPHRKQRYISVSLHEIYQPGSTVAMFKKAHNDGITCLDFDFPFGTMITAGYMDHTMKIWDLSDRKQIGILEGHNASVTCIQMDSSFNLVISGAKDATVRLWNLDLATEEGKNNGIKLNKPTCLHSFDLHRGEINALSLDRETLVSASRDKTIKQWDLKSGKCVQNLDITFSSIKTSKVDYQSFSLLDPPIVGALQCFETALATGTRDGMIRLWDLRVGKVIRAIPAHNGAVTALNFDSTHLITGSTDQTVKLWDLRSKNELDNISFELPVSNVHLDSQRIIVSTSAETSIYDRISCQQVDCIQSSNYTSTVSATQYKDKYLIEGHSNGDITVLSV